MTYIETRHYATASHGRILVGVEIRRKGGFQDKFLYDAEASLSPEEARRLVGVVKSPTGHFRSEDGRLTVWCMYEGDRIQWFSEDGEGICEDFNLGSDCWSAEFVKAIKHAILEADPGEGGE